ncbi:DUF7269 family protein [Halobacterium wangiae]|uniref:DUF7269 family protein n=1 Tax=Halobacterium wangiae TaxID=2902623 RepID=UPI001E426364|nr:hypothetical protein [Halobacterium wangiae]
MRFRTFVGILGVASLGTGLLFMYEPALAAELPPLEQAKATFQGIPPSKLLVGLGGALSLYAGVAAWTAGGHPDESPLDADTTRFGAAHQAPPEMVVDDDRVPVNALSGKAFEQVGESRSNVATVQHQLRATVRTALVLDGRDPEPVIEEGTWTDSRLAAAYLSESEDLRPSVWSRLRMWLDLEQERERRFRVTLHEVEQFVGKQTGGDQ